VDVQVERKPRTIVTRVSKRPRLGKKDMPEDAIPSDDNDEDEETSPEEEDSDFELTDEDLEETPPDAAAGPTRTRRMPVEEIIERCGKALPTMVNEFQDDDYLDSPIGTVLREYQRKTMDFVISLADGPDAAEYHEQVQKLAVWFIETADGVDVESNDGGYWKVLYLFVKHAPHQYSLAGYLTLFHFFSPFKKPKAGIVARVCQALILPPYQRMGHGRLLLKTVHELANDPSNSIVEINVEDPAPAFVALRNSVDYELFRDSFQSSPWLDSMYMIKDTSHPDFFQGVSDKDALVAGAVACITPRQVQIVHEIYKLSFFREEVPTSFRLMVKKRLARVHREDLSACRTKEEKQAMLAKIFHDTLEQYKAVLKRK
jgi:histone acetyltransferase 1